MTLYQQYLKDYKAFKFHNEGQLEAVMSIRKFIDEHFEQEVNLDLLAEKKFISKYHLLRLFKRYFGQTPRQYLVEKRLGRAKELLTTGTPVTETCYAVGFKSLGSFSSLFKSRNGVSPREFQKRARLKK